MQKACGRLVERVIIRSLGLKDHQDKATIIAWMSAMIIQMPKIAVTNPIINLAIISITSFLYIHSNQPLKINYSKGKKKMSRIDKDYIAIIFKLLSIPTRRMSYASMP